MSIIFYQTKKDIDGELKHTKAIIINMIFLTLIMSVISYFVYKQIDKPIQQSQQSEIETILLKDDDNLKNEIKSYFQLSKYRTNK